MSSALSLIPRGTSIKDQTCNEWKIGKLLGSGAFGAVYAARRDVNWMQNNDYAIKFEDSEEDTIEREISTYESISHGSRRKDYMDKHNLESLGLPIMLGQGETKIGRNNYRFLVMPRYGENIYTLATGNFGVIPEATAYRIAFQLIYAFQYIHSFGLVHSDVKGSNILVGLHDPSQVYLVDFGICKTEKIRSYQEGSPIFMARAAHQGITKKHNDLESLGYSLIEWLGGTLPWSYFEEEANKVLEVKEKFMRDVIKGLYIIFRGGAPYGLEEYLNYIAGLQTMRTAHYDKCRRIFLEYIE